MRAHHRGHGKCFGSSYVITIGMFYGVFAFYNCYMVGSQVWICWYRSFCVQVVGSLSCCVTFVTCVRAVAVAHILHRNNAFAVALVALWWILCFATVTWSAHKCGFIVTGRWLCVQLGRRGHCVTFVTCMRAVVAAHIWHRDSVFVVVLVVL
jgi:hypothetical protein